MLPSTLNDSGHAVDFGRPLWAGTIVGALILLLSIPVAQWIVLRRVLRRAWRWIPVNVAAWMVGLTFTLLPGPFVDEQTTAGVMVVAFVVGGICMAATVATCTGLWLRRELGQELRIESKKRVSLRESGLNA
ncbi:hypothetical protein BH683_008795 [Williamsia sp. 1138]|nr:hypothetical protein BH683_008795 [Williamsia sp. 1138]